MKRIIYSYLVAGLLLLIIPITSCKKEGPPGQDGKDGNANVIHAGFHTVSNWTQSGSAWFASFSVPEITEDVFLTGVVMVYIAYGTSEWWALPDLNGINSTSFGISVGEVQLYNQNTDLSLPPNPGADVYRVVVIPRAMYQPNVDHLNYSAVKQAYNLPN